MDKIIDKVLETIADSKNIDISDEERATVYKFSTGLTLKYYNGGYAIFFQHQKLGITHSACSCYFVPCIECLDTNKIRKALNDYKYTKQQVALDAFLK